MSNGAPQLSRPLLQLTLRGGPGLLVSASTCTSSRTTARRPHPRLLRRRAVTVQLPSMRATLGRSVCPCTLVVNLVVVRLRACRTQYSSCTLRAKSGVRGDPHPPPVGSLPPGRPVAQDHQRARVRERPGRAEVRTRGPLEELEPEAPMARDHAPGDRVTAPEVARVPTSPAPQGRDPEGPRDHPSREPFTCCRLRRRSLQFQLTLGLTRPRCFGNLTSAGSEYAGLARYVAMHPENFGL